MKKIINNLAISAIWDVRTLVEKIYENGSVFQFRGESRKIEDAIDFESRIFELPKPKSIKVTKFPPSKVVQVHNLAEQVKGEVVIKSTTHKDLYNLLDNFRYGTSGYHQGAKFDRYRNLYLAYEGLAKKKKYEFVAIRHVISHFEIDNKKTLQMIKHYFNDTRIDLKKKEHKKIFTAFYKELIKETERLLIDRILSLVNKTKKTEVIGNYIVI